MKMNPIFNLLRRTMFAALAATTIACGGDDPVVPQLPGGGNNGQDGTEEEKPEIKPDEGITLYGLVSDSEGNPLEGVVVSDGYSVVATDAKGVYQIVRSANAKYVFISAPSGYEIPTQANYGSYQGTYQAANSLTGSSTKPYRADFTLTKLSQSDTRFLLFGLGDPQPDNDEHIKRFRTETVPDVKKIKADYTIPTVGIALGDILGKGDAQTFTSMKRALGETGVPFFTTIGNHDKSSVDYTGDTYRDVLGPRWYSFNRGEVHFVAMDNCLFSGQDYTGGFTDEQVAWLEKDLSFVPTSKMIVLYYHIPLRDTNYRNRQKVLDLISKYQNPTLMCAHTHYFQPYHMRSHNLFERIHGGTCGYFWRSNCGGDGTPNGFMVYEIDGTKIVDTYFKASQRPDDHQIRLYHGDAVFAGPYATYKYDLGGGRRRGQRLRRRHGRHDVESGALRGRRQNVERHESDRAKLRRPLDSGIPHRRRTPPHRKRYEPLLSPVSVQTERCSRHCHRGACDRQLRPCLHAGYLHCGQRLHGGGKILTAPLPHKRTDCLFQAVRPCFRNRP